MIIIMEKYEDETERKEIYEAILLGVKDLEEGKTQDGPSALEELKEKYNL